MIKTVLISDEGRENLVARKFRCEEKRPGVRGIIGEEEVQRSTKKEQTVTVLLDLTRLSVLLHY